MRRPLLWVLIVILLLFFSYRALFEQKDNARYFLFRDIWEGEVQAWVQGEVEIIQYRKVQNSFGYGGTGEQTVLYLRNVRITLPNAPQKQYYLRRLLVRLYQREEVKAGNIICCEGILKEWEEAGNPGQFNAREYYKQQDIFYHFQGNSLRFLSRKSHRLQNLLYRIRDSMAAVYRTSLSEKEAGIICAVILGDKTLLDDEIKTLYQENGISHILAISGLHITILCTLVCRLLRQLPLARRTTAAVVILILLLYGRMTDFGISTSRAVIMMILFQASGCLGRTYDMPSAIACSAVLILLQRPFAIFSCSFQLSFGAVAGIAFLYPQLRLLCLGGHWRQKRAGLRQKRWEKEICKNHRYGPGFVFLSRTLYQIRDMLLISTAVQISLLPLLLWFFYEIPVYSIILNLLVIPLSSVLVGFAFLGGLCGCFCPLAGEFLLGGVYYVLRLYEGACRIFSGLPCPIWLTGRPAFWKIILYYFCLFLFILFLQRMQRYCFYETDREQERRLVKRARIAVLVPAFCTLLLLLPAGGKGLSVTFLDVGQGDGIFIREESGFTCLIDGGSSSEAGIGTYRILPFLKYHGIREIQMVIVTHSDEDHISGIRELLEEAGAGRIRIKTLFLPDVREEDAALRQLRLLAGKAGTATEIIRAGRSQVGKLALQCIYPTRQCEESSNASSVVMRLQYEGVSFLMTGDIEGSGEEQLTEILRQDAAENGISKRFTVLKVAHHGSRNSSETSFLQQVGPSLSVISCGKKNRYGHPHPELLERLEACGSRIADTRQQGAITVAICHGRISCRGFRRPVGNFP